MNRQFPLVPQHCLLHIEVRPQHRDVGLYTLYLLDQQESMHIKLLAPQHYNCIGLSQMSQLESAEEKIEWP